MDVLDALWRCCWRDCHSTVSMFDLDRVSLTCKLLLWWHWTDLYTVVYADVEHISRAWLREADKMTLRRPSVDLERVLLHRRAVVRQQSSVSVSRRHDATGESQLMRVYDHPRRCPLHLAGACHVQPNTPSSVLSASPCRSNSAVNETWCSSLVLLISLAFGAIYAS